MSRLRCRRQLVWPVLLALLAGACGGPAGAGPGSAAATPAAAGSPTPGAASTSSAVSATAVPATPSPAPCQQAPLPSRPAGELSYAGPLYDAHFHMPQLFKVPDHPLAPVLDLDVPRHDVACLFDPGRVRGAFAFYSIPMHLQDRGLEAARAIEATSPGVITPFLETVLPQH